MNKHSTEKEIKMNYKEIIVFISHSGKTEFSKLWQGPKKQAFSFILDTNQIGTALKNSMENFIKIENIYILDPESVLLEM